MEQQSYYRTLDNDGCSVRHDGDPLVVNCAGYARMSTPFVTNAAQGRQDYYLQIMAEGALTAYPDGLEQPFSAGMFVIYPPLTPYRYSLAQGEQMGYYWIHFSGFHAARLLMKLGLQTNRLYLTDNSEKRAARIRTGFESVFAEFINRRPGMDEACGSLLTGILVDLARGVDRLTTGEKRRLPSLAYLHKHFREDIRIEELAAMEHLSVSRYRAVFRLHTGYSPSEYRTALRLQYACDQLAKTDATVSRIAADCGYPDVLYFLRLFKLHKGITPSEYRASVLS